MISNLISVSVECSHISAAYVSGLHAQSPCHFTWQPSSRISQTLQP